MKDGRQLQAVVAGLPLDKPVDVAVVRDGASVNLKVTIEEQPERYGSTRVQPAQSRLVIAPELARVIVSGRIMGGTGYSKEIGSGGLAGAPESIRLQGMSSCDSKSYLPVVNEWLNRCAE